MAKKSNHDDSVRSRSREFVIETLTSVDGKAPSRASVEKATKMLCREFETTFVREPSEHTKED